MFGKGIKNVFLLFFGCLVGFVMLEVFLRLFNPIDFRVEGDKIVLPANVNYTFNVGKLQKLDEVIHYSRNSIGFRGEEMPDRAEGHLKIITVGGSTTECLYLSDDKTWSHDLCQKLKEKFRYIWLNNAGLDGHSTYGHIKLLEEYLVDLKPKPDVLLFLVGVNDMGRLTKTTPDEMLSNKVEGVDYQYYILKDWKVWAEDWTLLRRAAYHSKVFSLALNLSRYFQAKEQGLTHKGLDFATLKTVDMTPDDKEKHLSVIKKSLREYRKRLKKLVNLSRSNRIKPVFVTQPEVFGDVVDDVTKRYLGNLEAANGMNGNFHWEILELYNDITREVGKEENILVIDLAREMPKSTRYFYDGIHYGNKGAQKVAEIIDKNLTPFLAKEYPVYVR